MDGFFDKYYLGILAFVKNKIEDEMTAEEIASKTMEAAMRSRSSFSYRSEEFSWICGIAKHKIIDYYRKKRIKTILFSVSPAFEEIADSALSPERDALKNELKAEIKKTFGEISKGYKKILRLKYVQGHKTEEIAKKLGTTAKAIESKLRRAKIEFKKCWSYDQKKASEYIENRESFRDKTGL